MSTHLARGVICDNRITRVKTERGETAKEEERERESRNGGECKVFSVQAQELAVFCPSSCLHLKNIYLFADGSYS